MCTFLIVEGQDPPVAKTNSQKNQGHELRVLNGSFDPDNDCHCLDVIWQSICFSLKALNGL